MMLCGVRVVFNSLSDVIGLMSCKRSSEYFDLLHILLVSVRQLHALLCKFAPKLPKTKQMFYRDAGDFCRSIHLSYATLTDKMSNRCFNDTKFKGRRSCQKLPPKALFQYPSPSGEDPLEPNLAHEQIRAGGVSHVNIEHGSVNESKSVRHDPPNPRISPRAAPTYD